MQYVKSFIFGAALLLAPSSLWAAPQQSGIETQSLEDTAGDSWAIGSEKRSRFLYPNNYGQAGLFRVRSAESLPTGALTFGVGGEFYAINNAPNTGFGSRKAHTIAESLFVGYSPVEQLTLSLQRRNSSTTFGSPNTLISSLGDLNFSAQYAIPLNSLMVIAPVFNFLVASNFNSLSPRGNTVSIGGGLAYTFSLFELLGIPFFLHANAIYHMPQIRNAGPPATGLQANPETFFEFSRFNTILFLLGAELKLGDFIPFAELRQSYQLNSRVNFGDQPSTASVGTRMTPLSNKGFSILVGADVGLGRGIRAGVPFNPSYQILGQLAYTFGLSSSERKHYYTTGDVKVVDRKFIIKKNIRFKVNSATLTEDSKPLLNEIALVIQKNNVKRMLIAGHTDSSASDAYNQKLSKDRANSVRNYLAKRGVRRNTLVTQGLGRTKPKASNLTPEGRASNRRVEFFILE